MTDKFKWSDKLKFSEFSANLIFHIVFYFESSPRIYTLLIKADFWVFNAYLSISIKNGRFFLFFLN